MRGAIGRHRGSVDHRAFAALGRFGDRPRHRRATIGQIHRQHFLERRAGQALPLERACAQHQQPAAALGDEARGEVELIAGEEVRFDVAEDDGVVLEQRFARDGIAARQRGRAALSRLHEERVAAIVVLSLADDGVHVQAEVRGQRALQEGVLEARRAFHHQDLAPRRLRRHQHAAAVVLDHAIAAAAGDVHGVDRGLVGGRRDGEHFVDRGAVRGRYDAADLDGPAVGADAQLHRIGAEAAAHRRHAEVDRRFGQERLARRHVDDLAILEQRGRPHANREHPGPGEAAFFKAPVRGVAAIGEHDDAGHALVAITFGGFLEGRGQVAAPGGGGNLVRRAARQ